MPASSHSIRRRSVAVLVTVVAIAVAALCAQQALAGSSAPASASGELTFTSTLGPFLRMFSFEVHRFADGTVRGVAVTRSPTGVVSNISLTCFEVSGNQAIIGGVITRSSDPTRVGVTGAFAIQDNPDQISFFLNTGGESVVNCDNLLQVAGEPTITSLLADFGVPFNQATIQLVQPN